MHAVDPATFVSNGGYHYEEESVMITNPPMIAIKNDWRRPIHRRSASASLTRHPRAKLQRLGR